MLKNYFKIAFRNLVKNKFQSSINIIGLALGMAAATLLLLNIQYGFSIDQFHEKKTHIYEAFTKGIRDGKLSCWDQTSSPLTPALKGYPEIRNIAREVGLNMLFRYNDKKIGAYGNATDNAFLSMFSFPLAAGNVQTALKDPNDIVITQQLAVRLFGAQDPMGRTISTPNGDNFIVTGVLKDLPANTRFAFEYLVPWTWRGHGPDTWNNQTVNTWVELAPGADVDAFNKKIAYITHPNNPKAYLDPTAETTFLYPLTKVYLENRFVNGRPAGGNIDNFKMLGGLAAIILLIACINFMNLSTARSEKRGKEVGIRKVMGAARPSLIIQFIGESILMALLAGMIALMLVQLAIPYFDTLTRVKLSVPWQSPLFWLAALSFVFLTGMLAGSYPAFYLSSFRPIRVLKGVFQNGNAQSFGGAASPRSRLARNLRASVSPRKILVVVQFVFSIFLINFTVIYQKQIRHELGREVGFAKDSLVYHTMTPDLRRNYAVVKNELLGSGAAVSVSESFATASEIVGVESGLKWAGMDPKDEIGFVLVMEDGGYVRTSGLTLLAGRDIDIDKYPGDTLSCVVNETSVKALGFKNPLGQIIQDENEHWKIVGVVKDYLVGNPGQATPPVLIKGALSAEYINILINGNRPFDQNIRQTEAILKKYNPAYITDLQFADRAYEAKFRQARNVALLINTFTFIAIFVSCMGLLGLATYTAENRTREIGIRKVLGSGIAGIVSLLTRDFVKLVLISIVIASPLAWLFTDSFLSHYAYRTTLTPWVFAASGGAALLMALVTISFQVTRAALANPVKNLRTE